MKDQYFGDFGDYQKVSLIKKLNTAGLKILTYWMKTEDDGGTDGKHISYLGKPELWRMYEPEIFDFLAKKISKGRSLKHIEKSSHAKGITFINEHIEDQKIRSKILQDIISGSTADVVFFDPDNGIEVASTNNKNIHKYVVWDEIVQTYSLGKSVLIYQHFSRSNRELFITDKIKDIKTKVKGSVFALRVKHSVYFFIVQKEHIGKIKAAVEEFTKIWKGLAKCY